MTTPGPEELYQAELAKRKAGINKFARWLAQEQLDRRNWEMVADHVLAGDYEGCDRSVRQAIYIGLSALQWPKCVEAAARVQKTL